MEKKLKILLLLLLPMLLLLVLPSCHKNNDDTPPPVEIFPLKVGNHWVFQTTQADSTKLNHVNDVLKDTLINSEQWFVLTYDTVIRTICKNNFQGWWFLYDGKSFVTGNPDLYWKYPANVNNQYITADSSLVTVVSIDENITVPAGNFICYHYHIIHYKESYECEEYLAPGFGLIKHIVYAPGTGVSNIAEVTNLVFYKLYL